MMRSTMSNYRPVRRSERVAGRCRRRLERLQQSSLARSVRDPCRHAELAAEPWLEEHLADLAEQLARLGRALDPLGRDEGAKQSATCFGLLCAVSPWRKWSSETTRLHARAARARDLLRCISKAADVVTFPRIR